MTTETTETTGATETTGTTETTGATETTGTTETTGGEPTVMLPATYRFDCLDVVEMGDSNGDGQPDGDAFQAVLLENTWYADVLAYRLNILLTVQSRDQGADTAELVIGSGIGTTDEELCAEPTTLSDPQAAGFQLGQGQWQPTGAAGTCSEPAGATGEYGGTYTLDIPPEDVIYIYAQEADGTALNCVPGGATPDAVPLRAIEATVTVDASETEGLAAGQLSACLLASEAQGLCSCLSDCQGQPFGACAGCPDGSVPLSDLLGGLGPTDRCTDLMGETAYDVVIGFTAQRIDMDTPMVCGG